MRPLKSRGVRFFGVIVLVMLLGMLDWITGYELQFFVFYFLPVALSAWFLSLGVSVALAVLSAAVWAAADVLSGHVYPKNFFAVWDTLVRLTAFLSVAWAVSRMRQAMDRERHTAEVLLRTLSEVKVLQAFLPICSRCRKIRNPDGSWETLERYVGAHSDTRFSHGYCPDCARRVLEEAGVTEPTNGPGEKPRPGGGA
jgi:hypothetical protein